MFEFVLLDLDDTIFDFKRAERLSLQKTLQLYGVEPTQQICTRYSQLNRQHWERLERKELTRKQVLVGRFETLFAELGLQVDADDCNRRYTGNLSTGHYFLPGAEGAIRRLAEKYKLYLVSNGTAKIQAGRLASANINHLFQDIFISEAMGADKPDRLFFESSFARIPGFDRTKAIIVGDSLTSDIQGGINVGIATCWVNPEHKTADTVVPDYEIEDLTQLENLLDTLV